LRKSSKQNRRMIVTVTVVLAVAVAGLTFLDVNPVRADRGATDAGLTTQASDQVALGEGNLIGALLKMLSALAIVVAVVFGSLYLLRRLMGRRQVGSRGCDALEVLQTTYVGPHKAISLVRVANRSVLVGVTDSQISMLSELDAAETEQIRAETSQPEREPFSNMLRNASEKVREIGLRKKQAALET